MEARTIGGYRLLEHIADGGSAAAGGRRTTKAASIS